MGQLGIFKEDEVWRKVWREMPLFVQEDLEPWKQIKVSFENSLHFKEFMDLVGQKMGLRTRAVWFPKAEVGRFANKRWINASPKKRLARPRHPVYVISKGRWESRQTSKALDKIGVPYSIVVEPQERKKYAAVIDPSKILVLPFSNLGQGSIPARNWVWEHSIKAGAERHWIIDDNIREFYRLCYNRKIPVGDGTIFRIAEEFTDRYENVAQSGFNYEMFAPRKTVVPPYYLNTRVYSCILIRNDLPYRWRGRYNEDTDLSLRILKDGWCTVLFNAFLADKAATMTMKGGNMTELYQGDGRLKMAESLVEQHPDVTKVTWKWNRHQHVVDYRKFKKNKLKMKPGLSFGDEPDEGGMVLQYLVKGRWVTRDGPLDDRYNENAEPEEDDADES